VLAWAEGRLKLRSNSRETAVLVLPAPRQPEARLFTERPDGVVFWQPDAARALVGLGIAAELVGAGEHRFAAVRSQAAAWSSKVETWDGAVPRPIRWFGGFSFAPGQNTQPPWREFGDARFVLPRLLYERIGDRSWLTVVCPAAERDNSTLRTALLGQVARLLTPDVTQASMPRSSPRSANETAVELDGIEYRRRVRAIQQAIAAGQVRKVVAARRVVVHLPEPTETSTLLERLRAQDTASTVYAFRFEAACFVGASPERLVNKQAGLLETEAVAGSAPAGPPENAERLLNCPKNRLEHQMVVDDLCARLSPLCEYPLDPGIPRVRLLRRVLHLWTPLPARLRLPLHVLELVERLHPSAAVGGLPGDRAVDWILSHEPHARGWYAAPVGWFDQRGDGDFVVALRSGVLLGTDVYLFAGAGIVPRSDAEQELRETELKLTTLRAALGLEAE
jgi:isochorismate synthase